MTTWWKSIPKIRCRYCGVWYHDNAPSKRKHEESNTHKERLKNWMEHNKKKTIEIDEQRAALKLAQEAARHKMEPERMGARGRSFAGDHGLRFSPFIKDHLPKGISGYNYFGHAPASKEEEELMIQYSISQQLQGIGAQAAETLSQPEAKRQKIAPPPGIAPMAPPPLPWAPNPSAAKYDSVLQPEVTLEDVNAVKEQKKHLAEEEEAPMIGQWETIGEIELNSEGEEPAPSSPPPEEKERIKAERQSQKAQLQTSDTYVQNYVAAAESDSSDSEAAPTEFIPASLRPSFDQPDTPEPVTFKKPATVQVAGVQRFRRRPADHS